MKRCSLTHVSAVDLRIDVCVPRAEVDAKLDRAIMARGKDLEVRGFRRGKVPLVVLRQKIGARVAKEVIEAIVMRVIRAHLEDTPKIVTIGDPLIISMEFEEDLVARAYVAKPPKVDLADAPLGPVTRFVREFHDADVQAEIELRRARSATLVPRSKAAKALRGDVLTVDVFPIGSSLPAKEGVDMPLDAPTPEPIIESLVGISLGQSITVEDQYRLEVRALRYVELPEYDVPFIRQQTAGTHGDHTRFEQEVRAGLAASWNERADRALQKKMVDALIETHDFHVPKTLVQLELENLVADDIKRHRSDEEFDEEASRERNRPIAERAARWTCIKRQIIKDDGLKASETDVEAECSALVGDGASLESVKRDVARQPRLRAHLENIIVERQVAAAVARRFTIVEKSRQDLERERAEG